MNTAVKTVLIGVGGYGNTYVNAVLDDDRKDLCDVVGLIDPFPQSCKRLDEMLAKGIKIYDTIEQFYAEHTAELAVISSPIQYHTRQIIYAMQHGSNVLCEKPLSGDETDAEKLIRVREETGKFVSIGYQWSHSDAILNLKKDIIEGVYGKPEMLKTIVLWPRNHEYFKRGTGWAGKLRDSDGTLVRDSVANNATAHYLHNILYVLGNAIDSSLTPNSIKSLTCRVNPIETFDTALLECGFSNGAKAIYIASHSVEKTRNPEFEYRFENGAVTCINNQITGICKDGKVINYGNPFANDRKKLWMAIDNVISGTKNVVCGIEAASVHTNVIAAIHKNEIHTFPNELIKTDNNNVDYCEGLYNALCSCYESESIELAL